MGDEQGEAPEPSDGTSSDEPAGAAVFEAAATGSVAGPAGLIGGALLGWLIARTAKRRRSAR